MLDVVEEMVLRSDFQTVPIVRGNIFERIHSRPVIMI